MKKLLVIGLVSLSLVSGSVSAENWIYVGTENGQKIYVDSTSRVKEQGDSTYQVKFVDKQSISISTIVSECKYMNYGIKGQKVYNHKGQYLPDESYEEQFLSNHMFSNPKKGTPTWKMIKVGCGR